MKNIKAYAAMNATSPLAPLEIERRATLENDVAIEILYCGVCHSDIHSARNEWGGAKYPLVPGHEIIGRVIEVGSQVKGFKVGEAVGVGCFVDSCRQCSACQENLEQYCEVGATFTYNSSDKHLGGQTYGGYSQKIVVDQKYVLRIPKNIPLDRAAPLLCAGITTYSPLKNWKIKKGDRVGVVGLGGLGHMAVKLAHAMGAEVTLFSTSENKRADAQRLGAKHFVLSKNTQEMKSLKNHFDLILNTVSANINLDQYIGLLKRDGTLVLLGIPEAADQIHAGSLIDKRKRLAGSLIGGIQETQEMLDFCASHNIASDIELIAMKDINLAYERMIKGDVKYRFVIDMKQWS